MAAVTPPLAMQSPLAGSQRHYVYDTIDPEPTYLWRPKDGTCKWSQQSAARVYTFARTLQEAMPLMNVTKWLGLCLHVLGVIPASGDAVSSYINGLPQEKLNDHHRVSVARKHISQWLTFRTVLAAVRRELHEGEAALVLESDARLTRTIDSSLHLLLTEHVPRDWNIMYVGSCMDRGAHISSWTGVTGPTGDLISPYLRRSRHPQCTHALAINATSAAYMAALLRPSILESLTAGLDVSTTYDIMLAELADAGKLVSYTAWPPLAVQNGCGFRFNGLYFPAFVPPKNNVSWCDHGDG